TELYAKFASAPARAALMNNINYPNRDIQQAVIAALYFCKFQATDERDILAIKQKINETVENIVWVMACLNDIEDEKNTLKLVQSLDLERTNSIENLFNLLSLLNEPRLINLIQKTIIGKNNIFAVEIIDNNFPQEIKQLIKPLFDDLSTVQKIKKLGDFFPQREMSLEDRLKDIIKRDYSKLGTWTVARAVELLGKQHKAKTSDDVTSSSIDYKDLKLWVKSNIKDLLAKIRKSEMPDEMFLCLYHTDEMVYSTAAKIIYEENPLKCSDYLSNMSSDKQLLYAALKAGQPTLIDKIKHLKKHPMYFNVPEYLLAKLAKHIEIHSLKQGDELNADDETVYLVEKGILSCNVGVGGDISFVKNDIITKGFNLDHDVKTFHARKDSEVLTINRFEYFNTLIHETDIIPYLLDENNRAMMITHESKVAVPEPSQQTA
ncbi:MAG: hypothetical protein II480_02545, partial [Bacteroidales bacterium]|nr:hypothetical protein [Bacteroidales bacterium]